MSITCLEGPRRKITPTGSRAASKTHRRAAVCVVIKINLQIRQFPRRRNKSGLDTNLASARSKALGTNESFAKG
jgi:hypothetical protein